MIFPRSWRYQKSDRPPFCAEGGIRFLFALGISFVSVQRCHKALLCVNGKGDERWYRFHAGACLDDLKL